MTQINFGTIKVDITPMKKADPKYVPTLDTKYLFPKEMYFVYEGLQDGHVYIHGETGTGKSDGVLNLFALMNKEIQVINMNGVTTPDNFVGYLTSKNGTVEYVKGILLEAMEKGQGLLVDEIDFGSGDNLCILHNVLQFGRYTIPETKETVVAKEGFVVVATANTSGSGDSTGFYIGTKTLNKALTDRFNTIVEFVFPSKSRLKKILLSKLGESNVIDTVVYFTMEMRHAISQKQIYMPFGIRSAIKLYRKMKSGKYSNWDAVQISFANSTDPASKSVIKSLVKRVFPKEETL
jgi:MoxR-like ATPase